MSIGEKGWRKGLNFSYKKENKSKFWSVFLWNFKIIKSIEKAKSQNRRIIKSLNWKTLSILQ